MPDDKRFGIFWMDRQALAQAASTWRAVSTMSSWNWPQARHRTRRLRGSIGSSNRTAASAPSQALQLSHWTVENELAQLQSFGFMLPLVFLLVAFILNVARRRSLQRPQIAALKALGYSNVAIGWHCH